MAVGQGNAFEQLRQELGRSWDAIRKANTEALAVSELLRDVLSEQFGRISSSDADIVVFGSLARKEWTNGSDVDWTLLLDGQAKPEHRLIAQNVTHALKKTEYKDKVLPSPGTTGIFGSMAFSHDIIHHIGGQSDTNKNITQRILLLLESAPLRSEADATGIGAHERVVRGILDRYLYDDTNFLAAGNPVSRIPRFLLNDIVRFWRTMCVDFASKEWEQGGVKWALRNIKLRIPRKLIFVSGLLTVFSCFENPALAPQGKDTQEYRHPVHMHLAQYASLTPLEIVAMELSKLSLKSEAGQLLDLYDAFLTQLDDPEVRERLEKLLPQDVYLDDVFMEVRELSHQFQDVLTEIFFQQQSRLLEFTKQFGVF